LKLVLQKNDHHVIVDFQKPKHTFIRFTETCYISSLQLPQTITKNGISSFQLRAIQLVINFIELPPSTPKSKSKTRVRNTWGPHPLQTTTQPSND
jgi:hypothetical protein